MEGFVDVAGGRLWYERAGDGFPVVLIHPGLWDSRIWDPQFEAFARDHDVIRYDQRGYGRSDRPASTYSDLRDLRALLASTWIERCALVGMRRRRPAGARLLPRASRASSTRSSSCRPGSPGTAGATPVSRSWTTRSGAALRAGEDERAMEIELAVWAPLSTREPDGPRAGSRWRTGQRLAIDDALIEPSPPAVDRLGEVHAATMIVVGDHDLEEVHQISDRLADEIPGAMKRVVADADQLVNVAKPERFNRLVLDFLAFRM